MATHRDRLPYLAASPVDPSRPRTYTPQDGDPGFYAVWDHWLLDTLSSWQRQAEGSYSIEMDDERAPSPLSRQQQEEGRLAAEAGVPSAEPAMLDSETPEPDDGDHRLRRAVHGWLLRRHRRGRSTHVLGGCRRSDRIL